MTPNIRDFNIVVTPNTELCFNLGLREHGDQVRKNTNLNYFLHHCCPVAEIAQQIAPILYKKPAYTLTKEIEFIVCVALLHDLEEDTAFNMASLPNMLSKDIGFDVMTGVHILSRPHKDQINVFSYLESIKYTLNLKIVKVADLTHNMSDLKAGNLLDKYTLCYNYLLS